MAPRKGQSPNVAPWEDQEYFTRSPIIMVSSKMGAWKMTGLSPFGGQFPLPWLWEEWYMDHPKTQSLFGFWTSRVNTSTTQSTIVYNSGRKFGIVLSKLPLLELF